MKQLRLEKGWSQAQVARKLLIPGSTYRDWEAGRKIPAGALTLISRIYGTSVSQLLGQKQEANVELAKALEHFELASKHLKSALAKL